MIRVNENVDAGNVGVLESKPFRLGSGDGFFLYPHPSQSRTLSQLAEPCLSCGRMLRLTTGTITVHGVGGHVGACEICTRRVIERGLIA
ncbi:MAG: hypothetical protein H0W76_02530 [Pyrinomonadaceae bacterium]|nr:hypothetical protein [Pyrinomonadaceae bacterium]